MAASSIKRDDSSELEPGKYSIQREGNQVHLAGDLRMADAGAIWIELTATTKNERGGEIAFELSKVHYVDGSVMALLVELRADLASRGVKAELVGASDRIEPLIDLYAGHEGPTRRKKRKPEGTIAHFGRATAETIEEGRSILDFIGNMVMAARTILRRPRSAHWSDIPRLAEKTGADAVPITLLINILVGFVMAFQSARQLKTYGANIYVADLVGISLTRELAPLMTAIIVCGRSGAAYAAEIGSMKVNEEVDAIRTLGLSPFAWLGFPRITALLIVVPILTILSDVVGIFGGLAVGALDLDITPIGYLNETAKAVRGWDVMTGLIKSFCFAVAIGFIACQQGFAASGGAEGVGRRTTSTVVTSLFAIVLIDTLFTVIFRFFNV